MAMKMLPLGMNYLELVAVNGLTLLQTHQINHFSDDHIYDFERWIKNNFHQFPGIHILQI